MRRLRITREEREEAIEMLLGNADLRITEQWNTDEDGLAREAVYALWHATGSKAMDGDVEEIATDYLEAAALLACGWSPGDRIYLRRQVRP